MSGSMTYVANANDEVEPNSFGDRYYQCGCGGWSVWGREAMRRHFASAHGGNGRFGEDERELGEMLEAYKKQVEREFAQAMVSMLELVAEAKDEELAKWNDTREAHRLEGALGAVLQAIDSVKVMGGIEL